MKQSLYLDNNGKVANLLFNRHARKLYDKLGIPKSKICLQICDINDEIFSDTIKEFGYDNYKTVEEHVNEIHRYWLITSKNKILKWDYNIEFPEQRKSLELDKRTYGLMRDIGRLLPEEIINIEFKDFFKYKDGDKRISNISPVIIKFNNLKMAVEVMNDKITLWNMLY